MKNLQLKIYLTLGFSFSLLLFSLMMSYGNVQKNSKMLKYLERDQIKLTYYVNKLNYEVKKNQATLLQATLLKDLYSKNEYHGNFEEIRHCITKLDEFIDKHTDMSQDFVDRLKIIKKRVIAYKLVENSVLEAIASKDELDIQDAFVGFNDITNKFSNDADMLIEYANAQLYGNIIELEVNNKYSSNTLLFSFLVALLLIIFSIYKFNILHKKLASQLSRAQNAEKDLKLAQTQLLKYNDDLEDEINKKSKELHQKIYTHFLSGLPNRNKLLEDANENKFTKIAILNIDKFQSFNDIYGEEVGNIAIKMSADFLKEQLKFTQFYLYHISGDEFVVTSSNDMQTPDDFINSINEILTRYKEEKFIYEDKIFQFMMSSGVSYGSNKKILAYADMALKDAKKRNIQLSVFNEDKKLEKVHKDDIECHKKLVRALDENKVISYYQPITPIADKMLPQKYESLVRLDSNGTIIPPFRFIDVAKANRIYYKITRAVIKNTLSTIEKYKIESSLNISLSDISNEKTMAHFFEIIQNYKYNELLTVELLETEDFTNYEEVYNFCVKVRSFGIKIALDDFGSGYSNFSHILHLPVDYIKIDASLISNIDRDHNSRIMVETIVELAHKLHVLTIAEFVSSKEILDTIKDVGVDYAQGYYVGKPEPIEEYLEGGVEA